MIVRDSSAPSKIVVGNSMSLRFGKINTCFTLVFFSGTNLKMLTLINQIAGENCETTKKKWWIWNNCTEGMHGLYVFSVFMFSECIKYKPGRNLKPISEIVNWGQLWNRPLQNYNQKRWNPPNFSQKYSRIFLNYFPLFLFHSNYPVFLQI